MLVNSWGDRMFAISIVATCECVIVCYFFIHLFIHSFSHVIHLLGVSCECGVVVALLLLVVYSFFA